MSAPAPAPAASGEVFLLASRAWLSGSRLARAGAACWLFHHPTAGLGRAGGATASQVTRTDAATTLSSISLGPAQVKYLQMKLPGKLTEIIKGAFDNHRWASLAPTGLSLPADGGGGAESAGESWQ